MKSNGDIVKFLKEQDYKMVNNELGHGSFGQTVLLQDPFIDELFVAKKYSPNTDDQDIRQKFYKNFLDEIKIMYKLNHRNIVRIYNYYAYQEVQTGYIIMEYIEGISIAEWFDNYSFGFESASDLNGIFLQLIDAFDYLQSNGVIHRDIRENNILIDSHNNVKIIDFGIGKTFDSNSSSADSLYGEINRENSDTLPQEYFEGKYSSLTDMFYLGELLNRMINTYHIEFANQPIIDKMMAKNPDERFSSFSEIKVYIDNQDLRIYTASDRDKEIYTSFAESLCSIIAQYNEKPVFINDVHKFILNLNQVLDLNLFEYQIQNNVNLISSIVLSNYSYYRQKIDTQIVKDFYDWIKNADFSRQQIILSNLINKLSTIKVEMPDEYPF